MLNTLKTTVGYLSSLVRKYSPLTAKAKSLDDIYNFLPITERLYTSGQPEAEQYKLIRDAGFKVVINLAPHDAENSLKDEAAVLSALGMEYTHIPVNFVKPSDRKFKIFVERMRELEGEKVWVHCAANMRVSAFMFRYRTQIAGESVDVANADLQKIWNPIGVWRSFVERRLD